MNKEQIIELIKTINTIIDKIENEQFDVAWRDMALVLPKVQQFVVVLLEYAILEQDVALMLLTDLVQAMEQKDEVLLLDTIKYGIQTLLLDILRIMEDEENE